MPSSSKEGVKEAGGNRTGPSERSRIKKKNKISSDGRGESKIGGKHTEISIFEQIRRVL